MKKLINLYPLYLYSLSLFIWILSVSISYKDPMVMPKVYKNINGSSGDIISINKDGIWTIDASLVTLWDENGDVKQAAVKPINTCDRLMAKDSFIGFYGRCGNAFYKITTSTQSFVLRATNHPDMIDLCIADSNLLTVNHNAIINFTNFIEDYNLIIYPNISNSNGYLINQQQAKNLINCLTYCEMNKGEVYFIESYKGKGDIKKIVFNKSNISIQSYAKVFNSDNLVYYKLNKLNDSEMVLSTEHKLYFYQISSQGLTLKSEMQ
jgi:hypothetical protein